LQYVVAQLTQIGSRLNRYLLFKKISIDTLARKAAISSTLISNMLNGGSYDFIFFLKVVHLLPDLNTHWVFTGEGEMLLNPGGENTSSPTTKTASLSAAVLPELSLPAAQKEIAALRKQLEEKNELLKRLKGTLDPVQKILMEIN
jgi:hypothetical protein